MSNDLFKLGMHVLHSGMVADFKIDCDALTAYEVKALVSIARRILPPFRAVKGIPTGGLAFAKELEWFADPDANTIIIADDVLTTGRSMEEFKAEIISESPRGWGRSVPRIEGIVLFARGPCPQWVAPIFTLNSRVPQEMTIHDRNRDHRTVRPSDRASVA